MSRNITLTSVAFGGSITAQLTLIFIEPASCKALIAEIAAMSVGELYTMQRLMCLASILNTTSKKSELFPECWEADMDLEPVVEQLALRKSIAVPVITHQYASELWSHPPTPMVRANGPNWFVTC